MKKLISIIIAASFALVLATVCFAEFKASFAITGPDTVRAGNTLTVQFKADGNGICGFLADITYDASKLTYKSSSGELSDWRVEINEKSGKLQIWAEENNGFKSPIKSQKTVVSLSFKVSESAAVGDKISIKADISQVSDTENELSGLSASYSVKIARPLSSDSSLKSLSVDGYKFTAEFSPKVTEYTIDGEVEFTRNALKVNAKANDGEASVDISGARLSVGMNTIRIKVTAENDSSTTTYTIKAKMKQDPNYVASSDASLSAVTLSEGRLSPVFSPEIFDYIVYVPYEVQTMTVGCTPTDSRTYAEMVKGVDRLTLGENVFVIICTAEDGTVNEYRVTVMRMDEYSPQTETEEETETETETETKTETEPETEEETETETETEYVTEETETETALPETDGETSEEEQEDIGNAFTKKVPVWALLAAAVGGVLAGALGSVFITNSLKERK